MIRLALAVSVAHRTPLSYMSDILARPSFAALIPTTVFPMFHEDLMIDLPRT